MNQIIKFKIMQYNNNKISSNKNKILYQNLVKSI